jgi:uncharacterized protein
MAELRSGVARFCRLLREEYGFDIGQAQAHEALTALEAAGVGDPQRARYALRMICCSKHQEIEPFNRAFAAFFTSDARGVRQPRPPRSEAGDDAPHAPPASRRDAQDEPTTADAWQMMRAKYSPSASHASIDAAIPDAGLAQTLTDAGRLISALHLGRSRRWRPHVRGSRLDFRRTLRSSLQSGGDPLHVRTLGHPLRNPRILLLIDASRSMSAHAPALLQFGFALARRSRRTKVFVFSTELLDITRELRTLRRPADDVLALSGEAWGGGTRIGAALRGLTRRYASHIDRDTLLIVASDGLDTGQPTELRDAMRDLYRRTAGIIWLNPHAGSPAFEPSARAMRTALPYVSALLSSRDLRSLSDAAQRLRR